MTHLTPALRHLAVSHTGGRRARVHARRREMAVVCSTADLGLVRELLANERSLDVVLTLPVDDPYGADAEGSDGVDGFWGRLRARVVSSGADLVWCHANGAGPGLARRVAGELDGLGLTVVEDRAFFDHVLRRYPLRLLPEAEGRPGLADQARHFPRWIDVIGALLGLVLTLPLLIVLALAVRLTSSGPVLYRQTRVGLNGRHFQMLKFRSMHQDAERNGAVWAEMDDPRVTAIGAFLRRTHLDELPQLVNILVGDMSFIGPRPERPEFEASLVESIPHYRLRHRVKPGVTGWAQVTHPYGASVKAAWSKLELDLFYIRNRSWRLDLQIVWRTLVVSLFPPKSS